jgi:hypothetical protein
MDTFEEDIEHIAKENLASNIVFVSDKSEIWLSSFHSYQGSKSAESIPLGYKPRSDSVTKMRFNHRVDSKTRISRARSMTES